ncbi:MAG: DinB family protein [Candidatus Eisenbacteria bacterium]
MKEGLIVQLDMVREFFRNSTSRLEEKDSAFAPHEGMLTVAGQVSHTAQSIDWFMKGGFGSGFDMNFEKHMAESSAVTSLGAAMEWFERSVTNAKAVVETKSDRELFAPIPEGPVMAGAPRMAVIQGIADHTAHHRGALTVYARALGKIPAMPYGGE